jgi:hypothetical protein
MYLSITEIVGNSCSIRTLLFWTKFVNRVEEQIEQN